MTSAPATDERKHLSAIRAAFGSASSQVFDFGMVPGVDDNPGETPRIHWLASLERRYAEPRRAGRAGRSGWRLTVVHVGRTPDEARHALTVTVAALDEQRLVIDDETTTPLTHESTDSIERDKDGWFSGRAIFTYAL